MNSLWKPKNRKEKWIATAVLWFGVSAIYSLTGESQIMSVIGSVIAISGTVYVWSTKSDDYDNTGDIKAKERKEARALEKEEARKVRGTQLAYAKLRYFGGGVIDREKDLIVTVTTTGLTYGNEFIPMSKISNVSLETQSQVQSRLTVTRMVAFGVFALAAPKRKKSTEKFLAIDYDDGFKSTLILGGYGTTKIQSELIKAKRLENK